MNAPTLNGKPVKVFQVARNGSKTDVTNRFAGQKLTQHDIDHEKNRKHEVLTTDTPVNVYYEIVR